MNFHFGPRIEAPKDRVYMVALYRSGETVYVGASETLAGQALNPGTTFGIGKTDDEALAMLQRNMQKARAYATGRIPL